MSFLKYAFKLFQKTNVIFAEHSNIRNLVQQKRDSVYSHPEGETGIRFRINSAVFQYVWIYHSTAHNF